MRDITHESASAILNTRLLQSAGWISPSIIIMLIIIINNNNNNNNNNGYFHSVTAKDWITAKIQNRYKSDVKTKTEDEYKKQILKFMVQSDLYVTLLPIIYKGSCDRQSKQQRHLSLAWYWWESDWFLIHRWLLGIHHAVDHEDNQMFTIGYTWSWISHALSQIAMYFKNTSVFAEKLLLLFKNISNLVFETFMWWSN